MITLSIDQLMDHAEKHAHSVLIGHNDKQITPTFLIQFNDRAPSLIATPWANDKEKRVAVVALRQAMKQYRQHVVSYSFISEAWLANEVGEWSGVMPRDREDRREAVIINAFNHTGGKMRILAIERDAKGRVVKLTPERTEDDYTALEGQLVNLLKDENSQVH